MVCKKCKFDDGGAKIHPCRLNKDEKKEGLKLISLKNGWLKYKNFGKFFEYRGIWVIERDRRKGIGSKLIIRLKKIAARKPIYAFVNTNADDWLGKFLLSVGFKFIPKEPETELLGALAKDYQNVARYG